MGSLFMETHVDTLTKYRRDSAHSRERLRASLRYRLLKFKPHLKCTHRVHFKCIQWHVGAS